MKKLIVALVTVGSFLNVAQADSYTISAARVSGQLNCVYSKADGGSTQCSTQYGSQGLVSILMNAKADGTGYTGTDQVSESNAVYLLAVESDASKNLTAISSVQLAASGNTFDGGISASDSNKLSVVNIAPIHIEGIDDQTALVSMSFYAYAPATTSNMVTNRSHQDLTNYVQAKIQPALNAVLR